jgi:excinuclease ABC subunit C
VATSANSGSRRDLNARRDIPPNSPLSCEGLRATALSLSHLTWSMGTSITVRTCHQTTSFPVYWQNSSQATWVQVPLQRPLELWMVLAQKLSFSADADERFFLELPAGPAVFVFRGDGDPYVSKTANLRKRLQRLLGPPAEQSKRLNLRNRVREIEFTMTGSDFESQFLLYRILRVTFPKTYGARLRLRPAPLVKFHLENAYPRASVTTKLAKLPPLPIAGVDERMPSKTNLYYGPFPSRAIAEKFASAALDFFKMRRCVDDLHPDPAFPGCVYSEMKMCLAPCFNGCTDSEYRQEVLRVQKFFDTQGQSLIRELSDERDRNSNALAFEDAAAVHARLEKLKPLLAQLPEIVRRVDKLKALIIQPGVPLEGATARQSVSLFLFNACTLIGPEQFSVAPVAESRSMESRLEEAIGTFLRATPATISEHSEHLAILKRWHYRSTRVGEIFFADANGQWPMRRIVRGVSRVAKGEKSQEACPTFSAPPASPSPS